MKQRDSNFVLHCGIYQERPPGYQLIRVIGAGAFSQCWLGRHEVSGCLVAVKIISKKVHMAMVEREISFWRILDHPNIVQLYEVIPLQNNIYVTMEYASEGELFMLLAKNEGGLELPHALGLFAQICQAVRYCHSRGISHRDIKLENIFLCDNETTAKLGDFSFAAHIDANKLCNEWLGSREYSAPELLKNESYDPCKTDAWSLGVVLFALLMGYLPFSEVEDDCIGGDDLERRVCQRVIDGRLEVPSSFPPAVRDVLVGLLQYNPHDRWSVTQTLGHIAIKNFIQRPLRVVSLEDLVGNVRKEDLLGVMERAKDRYPDAAFAFYQILKHRKGQKTRDGRDSASPSPVRGQVEVCPASPAFMGLEDEQTFVNMQPKRWLDALIPDWSIFKRYRAVGQGSKNDSYPSPSPPGLVASSDQWEEVDIE